jgi:hypothetical protein
MESALTAKVGGIDSSVGPLLEKGCTGGDAPTGRQ